MHWHGPENTGQGAGQVWVEHGLAETVAFAQAPSARCRLTFVVSDLHELVLVKGNRGWSRDVQLTRYG